MPSSSSVAWTCADAGERHGVSDFLHTRFVDQAALFERYAAAPLRWRIGPPGMKVVRCGIRV